MMRILSAFALAFLYVSAQGQNPEVVGKNSKANPPYDVRGKIHNSSTGGPMEGVEIIIDGSIRAKSDSIGEFLLFLSKGTYEIKTNLQGYEARSKLIRVVGDGNIRLSLREIGFTPGFKIGTSRIIPIGLDSRDTIPPYSFTGVVVDGNIKPLSGANLYIPRQNIGTSTNEKGEFELELYEGTYGLQVSSVGFETETRIIDIQGSGKLSFIMHVQTIELDEVVIAGGKVQTAVNKRVGSETLNINSIKSLPQTGGEPDVLRALTLLPGISTPGEATSGFNVRGGGYDQNLILLDGAPMYNPAHLFGFFSSFNPSMVRNVTLYKGSIPAYFGGRGSSVVDISYKKGNLSEWTGDVTLGMLTSKYSAGGPIVPGKVSIMTGARASYTNWLLRQANDPDVVNSRASFVDGNFLANYAINADNDLEYSFYGSHDSFQFAGDTINRWQNFAHVLKYTSAITDRITLRLTGTQSRYRSQIRNEAEFSPFELESGVLDNQLGINFEFKPVDRHTFNFGGQTKFLTVDLGTLRPGTGSTIAPENIESENAIESGIYFQHDFDLTDKLDLSYGLRWSNFRNIGPALVNQYDTTQSRTEFGIIDQLEYGDNQLVRQYNGFEPRASINYQLNFNTSFKIGYNRMYQYIHLVSNTTSISPIDVWKLSDRFLKPEIVDQYSFGIFKTINKGRFEASVEGFYKDWDNVVEYKDGADLFLNDHLETELITGIGRSYGIEAYLEKKNGPIKGWLSYTYSRSQRRIRGRFPADIINDGNWFASNYDKPHNFTAVGKKKLGRYGSMSATWTFSTGRPLTVPVGRFVIQGETLPLFTERNGSRIPSYHRLDIAFRFRTPSLKKAFNGHWTFSIYNLYGRRNVFSAFFRDTDTAPPQAFRVSVIGAPFPSLSYELTF